MPIMRWYIAVPEVVVLELISYFDPLFMQLVFKLVPCTPRPFLLLDLTNLLYSQAIILGCSVRFDFLELLLRAIMAL